MICISNQLPQFYISENLIFNGLSKKLVGKRFLFNFPHLLLPFVNFSLNRIRFKFLRLPVGFKDRSICFHPMQHVSRFYCCTRFFLFELIKSKKGAETDISKSNGKYRWIICKKILVFSLLLSKHENANLPWINYALTII